MGAYFATKGEDRCEVCLKDFVPIRVGKEMGCMTALDAGAVEKDVDGVTLG